MTKHRLYHLNSLLRKGASFLSIYFVIGITTASSQLLPGILDCLPLAPVVNGTVQNVSCNGAANGSITANPILGLPPYAYTWSTGATTQSISGLGPGTYSVTVANGICNTFGLELVGNGGFEAGNTGFLSSYNFCNTGNCLQPEGRYAIANSLFGQNANFYHNNFTGTAYQGFRFLVVNGTGTPNTSVWCQTINVNPNSNYNFSTFVSSVNPASPALLQFSINGVNLGNVFQASSTTGVWTNFFATWNSGSATTANICIVNQNTTATGNDFGLDNISFMECVTCGTTQTFTVTQPAPLVPTILNNQPVLCFGQNTGSATIGITGGTAPYSVLWSNGQTGLTANNLAAGTYTATVTDARNCTASTSVVITQPASVLSGSAAITSNYNGTAISCIGSTNATITASASGGTPPYSYLWNTGATTATLTNIGAGTYTVTITDFNNCSIQRSATITAPAPVNVVLAVTSNYNGQQLSCNGASNGTVNATPSGGTAPYTYLWSNGSTTQSITGLSAGTYNVMVTDVNGCTASGSITVNNPPVLTATSSAASNYNGQNISCFGGSNGAVTVNAVGGTLPYSYLWSNGSTLQSQSGLASGTYTVVVTDANGCFSNSSVMLSQPTAALSSSAIVTSNYNGQNISCFNGSDGSVTVNATGGTAPYTYLWSNGSTIQSPSGLSAGTYNVTVTDANNCSTTASVIVNQPTMVTSSASITSNYNGQNISCNSNSGSSSDGSATATANGGVGPYSYSWSNGSTSQSPTGLTAGTYTVTVSDLNGCISNSSITLTEPTVLTGTASVASNYNGQNLSCNGSTDGAITASAAGGTAPYTYLWSNGSTLQSPSGLGAGTYSVTITDANGCTATSSVTIINPVVLTTTAQVISDYNGQDLSCNGTSNGTPDGIISATPNGGTAPYTYLWSNGATTQTVNNVGAGTYTVTVTDVNGCFTTASVTVTEPPVLTSTSSVTSNYNGQNISCNGASDGAVTVNPVGGTAPYTYLWSNGSTQQSVNGLSAGTYNVTITDANGCSTTSSVTVTEPAIALTATAQVISDYNGQDLSCNGTSNGTPDGIISATPNGGTAPYTYLWSNGATTQTVNNVGAGTYTVTVTDVNGCFTTASVTVTEPPVLTSTSSVTSNYNGQNISCNGASDGAVTVNPTGGTAPYTYLWSNGSTLQSPSGLAAGTYDVTITDANGCSTTSSVTVTEPAIALTATAQVTSDYNGQDVSCNGTSNGTPDGIISATPNGGTAPYTYLWSNGATMQTVNNVGAGTYTVTVTDVNGCFTTASVTVTEPPVLTSTSSVTSNYNGQNISCNGASDGAVTVNPVGGTAPYSYLWSNGSTQQSVNGLTAGTYNVTITDANGCSTTSSVTVSEPAIALSTTAQVISDYNGQDVSCNGTSNGTPDGIISATPNGGTAPYTYLWSNGATMQTVNNVGAGTYTVTVTDVNGCFTTASVTVTEPPVLTSTSLVTSNYNGQNISCNGASDGAVTVNPVGGTAPYSYLWSNGSTQQSVNGLSAGTYNVTITDANGCSTTSSVTVSEPAIALTATAQVTSDYNGQDVSCNGTSNGTPDGIISATPNGGTAPYTYLWSNGATTQTVNNVGAGTYTVTVTDVNGCFTTASVTVTEPPVLTSTSSVTSNYNGQNISCNGASDGAVTVNPVGGTAPYSYLWSNGSTQQSVNGLSAGTYNVTITDANGCSTTSSVTVSEPAIALTATAQVTSDYNGQDVSCNGTSNGTPDGIISATPNGGTAPYTYLWSNGATTQTVNNVGAGTYTVTVTDVNGCFTTASVTVTEPPVLTSTSSVTSNYNGQNISCNGASDGAVTVNPTGGTAPYTYLWSNGSTLQSPSGLAAGTYNVTITDANGCSTTSSVTVTEPILALSATSNVTSNYNGEEVSCNGSTDGIVSVSPVGGTFPYTYLWSNGSTLQSASGLGAATYNVIVTDVNGCETSTSVTVTEPSILTSSSSVISNYNGQDISCNSASNGNPDGIISTTAAGGVPSYTYLWSNGSSMQSPSGVGAGNYSVTVTDANGCTAISSVIVTEPTVLTASSSVTSNYNGQDISCNGLSDGAAIANPNGGTAPYSYLWSNGSTLQNPTGLAAGIYSVNVTDANGCVVSSSITVSQPTVVATTASVVSNYNGQNVSCNSASGNSSNGSVMASPSGGTSPYTYVWSNGAIAQTVTGIGAGTYNVVVSDVNGCNANANVSVIEPSVLTSSSSVSSNYNGEDISCNGSSNGSAIVNPAGGTAPYTYLWENGSTLSTTNNLSAGTYSVLITDANGCTSTDSVTITAPLTITLSAAVTNVLCFGNSTGAIDLTISGGVLPYGYNWSNGPSTQDVSGLQAGQYTVDVVDANGCSASITQIVTQPSQPVSGVITIDNVSCFNGNDGTIQVAPSGGTGSYSYSWSNGASSAINANISANTYQVVVTDSVGCTYTTSGVVQQPLAPISVSGVETAVACFGGSTGSIDLTVAGGTPNYSYQWSNGGQTQDISGLSAGQYSVTVIDSKGCIDGSFSITVTQPLNQISISAIPTNILCHNASTGTIDASVSGGTFPYVYQWSNGSQNEDIQNLSAGNYSLTITDANGCSVAPYSATISQPAAAIQINGNLNHVNCFGGSTGSINVDVVGGTPDYSYQWSNGNNSPDVVNIPAGTYSVMVEDANACKQEATFTIVQPPVMYVDGNVQDNLCYANADGAINVTVTGGVPGYTFSWSNGSSTEDLQFIIPGSYTLSVTDANGCNGITQYTVFEAPQLNISMQDVMQVFAGDEVLLTADVSGGTGSYSFIWTPEETLSCPTCQSTMASPLTNTNYIVTVIDENNCEISGNTHVNVDQDIFIPNAFTPNGNDGNDVFKPVVRMAKECSFSIFDRWGEMLYSSLDANMGWDGTYGGKPVPVDVYVYQVKVVFYNGQEKTVRGHVTVIR